MSFDKNSSSVIDNIEDEPISKGILFFGRDITKIPCFKESFLYGLLGGIGCGLITFTATSRAVKATNAAVYSFSAIVIIYWFKCRIQWSRSKFTITQTQRALKEYDENRGLLNHSNNDNQTKD